MRKKPAGDLLTAPQGCTVQGRALISVTAVNVCTSAEQQLSGRIVPTENGSDESCHFSLILCINVTPAHQTIFQSFLSPTCCSVEIINEADIDYITFLLEMTLVNAPARLLSFQRPGTNGIP